MKQASVTKKSLVSEVVPGVGFIVIGVEGLAEIPSGGVATLILSLVFLASVTWGLVLSMPGRTEPDDEYTFEMRRRSDHMAMMLFIVLALVACVASYFFEVSISFGSAAALFVGLALLLRGASFLHSMRGDGDGCED